MLIEYQSGDESDILIICYTCIKADFPLNTQIPLFIVYVLWWYPIISSIVNMKLSAMSIWQNINNPTVISVLFMYS